MEKPSILGMIWRPHVEFERIRQQPIIWTPLIWIAVLHVIGMLFVTRIRSEEWPLNAVQTPPTVSYSYMSAGLLLSELFSFLISLILIAFIVFGIAKALRKTVPFRQILSLSVFLYVIPTLGLLLQAITHVLNWGEKVLSYNLQDLFSLSDSHWAFALGFATIFTIWNWVLTALGFKKVIHFPSWLAIVLTVVLWYLPILVSGLFLTPMG